MKKKMKWFSSQLVTYWIWKAGEQNTPMTYLPVWTVQFNWKWIFLFFNQNIWCVYSKELAAWYCSFEQPKHMLEQGTQRRWHQMFYEEKRKIYIQFCALCLENMSWDYFIENFHQVKVNKGAKIRNRYNQVPHLTQDTNGNVTNSQWDTTNESQEVSPFPATLYVPVQLLRYPEKYLQTKKSWVRQHAVCRE